MSNCLPVWRAVLPERDSRYTSTLRLTRTETHHIENAEWPIPLIPELQAIFFLLAVLSHMFFILNDEINKSCFLDDS